MNIIPEAATFETTVRTLSPESARKHCEAIEPACADREANDCGLEFEWTEGYPPTVNDPRMAEYVATIAKHRSGRIDTFPRRSHRWAGRILRITWRRRRGVFSWWVGPTKEPYPSLHNDHYDFTDAAMGVGIRMFVELVRNWK